MKPLSELQHAILKRLIASGPAEIGRLAADLDIDQSQVSAACDQLAEDGKVSIEVDEDDEFVLGPQGAALSGSVREWEEFKLLDALEKSDGQSTFKDLATASGVNPGQYIRFLQQDGYATAAKGVVRLADSGWRDRWSVQPQVRLLQQTQSHGGRVTGSLLEADGVEIEKAFGELKLTKRNKKDVVDRKTRTRRTASSNIVQADLDVLVVAPARKQVTQLTDELLRSGEWRDADLRPYDVTLAAEPIYAGKAHPMVSIIEQTRRVFLEMGFDEINSPYVESSFWDFDALFQPQDHPARDMQDTFYVARPAQAQLPADETVNSVKATHEDGGKTESLGWRYRWDVELARRPVLRTHATAATIRALARQPHGPRKVFCVGPVFRRETVDYKHLPVFHQVDGVVIDAKASFADLLGTLATFYRKMGFQRFDFRPAFFPYTEPSVEVFVWLDKKGDWVEMGGAGMFRPEVTQPLGCDEPVLAWGLGLERLAMFRYELSNISELYRARLSWLKETPLCR